MIRVSFAGSQEVTSDAFEKTIDAAASGLRVLDLDFCLCSNVVDFDPLEEIKRFRNLQQIKLDLRGTGIQHLNGLYGATKLTHLILVSLIFASCAELSDVDGLNGFVPQAANLKVYPLQRLKSRQNLQRLKTKRNMEWKSHLLVPHSITNFEASEFVVTRA